MENSLEQPNLFSHATSELSQDAVLAWLLDWADPAHEAADPALHRTGQHFIKKLYEKADKPAPDFQKLTISKQEKKIDLLVRLEGMDGQLHCILIEDKRWSEEHGGQLARYHNVVKGLGISVERILPIFLKTGFQHEWDSIKEAGYWVFDVRDLLEIIHFGTSIGVQNDIFADYAAHLSVLESQYGDAETAFKQFGEKPIGEWDFWEWKGYLAKNKDSLSAWMGNVGTKKESLLVFHFGHVYDMEVVENDQSSIFNALVDLVWSPIIGASIAIRLLLRKDNPISREGRDAIARAFKKVPYFQHYPISRYKHGDTSMKIIDLPMDMTSNETNLTLYLEELEPKMQLVEKRIIV